MADNQLLSPMPLITLDAGCTITLEAIDPASGAAVTGVTVSQVTIYGQIGAGGDGDGAASFEEYASRFAHSADE